MARVVKPVASAFHPSTFIREELRSRRWSRARLAREMGGEFDVTALSLDMYLDAGPMEPCLRMGRESAEAIGRAFGTGAEFWLNLEASWLAWMRHSASDAPAPKRRKARAK